MTAPDCARSPLLSGVRHGFFGRSGGVSTGEVAGLNAGLGSGDEPDAVMQNRRIATDAILPDGELVSVYQIHSALAVEAVPGIPDADRPHADALVTNRPGLVLGIVTADCAPVLFADTQAGVIGAAHAGWKGALGGVTDATIALMETLGADRSRIVAAIGPCISRVSYEVDDGFARRFEEHDPANAAFFSPGREGHRQFDLEAYVAARLAQAGVIQVDPLGIDTYSQAERYFSFRRATHAGEATYGRQLSLIGLG
jgi:YfiH family protein